MLPQIDYLYVFLFATCKSLFVNNIKTMFICFPKLVGTNTYTSLNTVITL